MYFSAIFFFFNNMNNTIGVRSRVHPGQVANSLDYKEIMITIVV